MRFDRSFLILGALLGCGMAHGADIRATAKASVVAVRAYTANNRLVHGSAVRVGPERFVTNCHVTLGARRIEVQHNAERTAARVESEAVARDICVLRVPGPADAVPAHRSVTVSAGQTVYAAGFPADRDLTITAGRVIALHEHDGSHVIQVSAPFDYGSSGGALLDEEGRLIGILAFKALAGGEFHFALPVAWLYEASAAVRAGTRRAFWQAEGRELPYFLRATSLQAAGKWQALAELTREWTRAEPLNPGAWRALREGELRIDGRQTTAGLATKM